MDYVTRQFVNLAKKLRKELRAAVESLEKSLANQSEAIRGATQADRQQQNTPTLTAELNVPPTQRYKEETNKTKDRLFGSLKVWIEIVGLWVVVSYTTATYLQLREMKASVDAANRSAAAAEYANLPWLGIDNTGNRGITPYGRWDETIPTGNQNITGVNVTETYAEFSLTYNLKNFGHSPAKADVRTQIIDTLDYPKQPSEILKRVEDACNDDLSNARKSPLPITVLPGEINYTNTRRLIIGPKIRERGKFKPVVIGCIWYRTIVEDEKQPTLYGTRFYGNIFQGQGSRAVEFPLSVRPYRPEEIKITDVNMVGGVAKEH
jgi:hypothetical protein